MTDKLVKLGCNQHSEGASIKGASTLHSLGDREDRGQLCNIIEPRCLEPNTMAFEELLEHYGGRK